jgi:LmbE family N-acetylglucosaminyl deacetylase
MTFTLTLSRTDADVFVPDGAELGVALARTTHLAIGAHADDLEIMAAHGILECFGRTDRWFTGVVVTDGAGSSREQAYANTTDEEMRAVRRREQRKAAAIGEYAAQLQLSHPSATVKSAASAAPVIADLEAILRATRPEVVYTHNLADKHDTHVAVTLRVLAACRKLSPSECPRRLIGCEVWRDLDWLPDRRKVVMPVDERENLQAALMGVFDSQIEGGKRYDLATLGRRRAHATYFESHTGDRHRGLVFGMDLTELLEGGSAVELATSLVRELEDEVRQRLLRLGGERSPI